ncbi:CarboxypepD_reg-like domain-containing protein [Chitinophaga jiangningensis]|uniref:CarboxypepD_reg-like domain-containing protein n=1 Tax=Chitinophaga jiangningensis TaxID=1419482 RepID=A0A1M7N2A8_9BACT|nr:M1 family aminopeptidase [Chitinophaga jiangningensis]SHM97661.1 CarboxypepD_reg-like domain-containing protein [Chitinophaga jiangningensis]
MRFYCLALIFSLCSLLVFSQQSFRVVSGKIRDARQQTPLPYASVQALHESSRTTANGHGDFLLKIPLWDRPDSLVITFMGYRRVVIPVPQEDGHLNVNLEQASMELAPVIISTPNGQSLIEKAIARMPANYDTARLRLSAFYREDIRMGQDTLNYNESVLDIFKVYRQPGQQDQIRLVKGRKHQTPPRDDPRFYNWISNITNTAYSSLMEDLQKSPDAPRSFLNPDNFYLYRFVYREAIMEGDRRLLIVDYMPRKPHKKALTKGTVYLEDSTLAIVKVVWSLTPDGANWINKHGMGGVAYTIMSRLMKASLTFQDAITTIQYKPYKGKWYLEQVHRHWELVVNSRSRQVHNAPWKGDFLLQVTGISTDSVKPFDAGVASKAAAVGQLIPQRYDTAFWENFNILLPDIPDTVKLTTTKDTAAVPGIRLSNRENGFTRRDTLRGMLSPFRTCYDVTFYNLDVSVSAEKKYIRGRNEIQFRVMQPFSRFQLDLYANMVIDSVLYKDAPVSYTREYDAVFITLPDTLISGQSAVTIVYHGQPQEGDARLPMYGGILYDKDPAGNPWTQMVCQGSGASVWWPNKDHQSDEPDSMRIAVTVPAGYTEISNGQLLSKVNLGDTSTRYEWRVTYPVNNYNVSFCIGKYSHFTDQYRSITGDTLVLDYYVLPMHLERARKLFPEVKQMLATFEKAFGAYPFPRDGFKLVESPYPMEHQSIVCFGKILNDTGLLILPSIIWHESAHEWWGNAITSEDIADMWIHEGFATYAEVLMTEMLFGKAVGAATVAESKTGVLNKEPVIGVYNVNHIHYDIGDMYTKASLMLHTLRQLLPGDSAWYTLLNNIQRQYRYRTLSSDSLEAFISHQMKRNLKPFFDQYLRLTTIPRLEYSLKNVAGGLQLRYRWAGTVAGFDMPVKYTIGEKPGGWLYPEAEWKVTTLKKMNAEDVGVDDENFYITVEKQ